MKNGRNELADFLGVSRNSLSYVLFIKKVSNYYTTFDIPKKNGGFRTICAPTGNLKIMQRILAQRLLNLQRKSDKISEDSRKLTQGFTRGKSFITNADVHKDKIYVINFDIEDFFSQFHFGRIVGYFEKNRYYSFSHSEAIALAQLTCYEGHLPQGAPTSPVITNMICEILDQHLLKIAKKYKMDYTRYADDLTFSTSNRKFAEYKDGFIDEIKSELNKSGLPLNESKTRIQYKDISQHVTGLVVNEVPHVDRKYYKLTRAICNDLYHGKNVNINGGNITIKQLEGRVTFEYQIAKYNNQILHNDLKKMYGRMLDVQKFLFYKTFIVNNRPLIITEGKTDVIYIQSALRKMYDLYPNLVNKRKNDFQFSLSFFRRTEMIQNIFRISADGAEALSKIYCLYVGAEGAKNYYKYFIETCKLAPKYPTILLFDNEMDAGYPLKKFSNKLGNRSIHIFDKIKTEFYSELIPNSKLYLVTIPKTKNDNCEIESLFAQNTLNHLIDGRKFTTKNQYDSNEYYGKQIFSKYILYNYQKIDFLGFRKLLNIFVKIVNG